MVPLVALNLFVACALLYVGFAAYPEYIAFEREAMPSLGRFVLEVFVFACIYDFLFYLVHRYGLKLSLLCFVLFVFFVYCSALPRVLSAQGHACVALPLPADPQAPPPLQRTVQLLVDLRTPCGAHPRQPHSYLIR
jgi:hypothetical protein